MIGKLTKFTGSSEQPKIEPRQGEVRPGLDSRGDLEQSQLAVSIGSVASQTEGLALERYAEDLRRLARGKF
jgi:hypothetical protein